METQLRSVLVQKLQDRPVAANLKDVIGKVSIAELQVRRDHSNIPLSTKSSGELWSHMNTLDSIRFVGGEQLCPSEKSFKFSSRCASKVVSSQSHQGGMIKFTGMSKGLQRRVIHDDQDRSFRRWICARRLTSRFRIPRACLSANGSLDIGCGTIRVMPKSFGSHCETKVSGVN